MTLVEVAMEEQDLAIILPAFEAEIGGDACCGKDRETGLG